MRIKLYWRTFVSLLQTLTGLFLFGFMSVHFFGVSLINFGPEWLNAYTKHLDKSNLFIVIMVLLVILVLVIHIVNGLRIMFPYMKKNLAVLTHLVDVKYRDSYLWYVLFLAGGIVAVFVAIHLIVACFASGHTITTADIIKEQFQNSLYWYAMATLLAGLAFHMMYGMRNVVIKYDILPKYRKIIFSALCIGGILLFLLGLNNLFLLQ